MKNWVTSGALILVLVVLSVVLFPRENEQKLVEKESLKEKTYVVELIITEVDYNAGRIHFNVLTSDEEIYNATGPLVYRSTQLNAFIGFVGVDMYIFFQDAYVYITDSSNPSIPLEPLDGIATVVPIRIGQDEILALSINDVIRIEYIKIKKEPGYLLAIEGVPTVDISVQSVKRIFDPNSSFMKTLLWRAQHSRTITNVILP